MPRAGIALGSNLGDRLAHMRAAFALLRELSTPGAPVLRAPVYQTEPRFCPPGSPDFLNSVIEIEFEGDPLELLAKTRGIERKLGRGPATERNAPRVIDLDLLYLGEEVSSCDVLELPHPRIAERRFVLQPLADIRPDLVLAGQPQSIARMLANLPPDDAPIVPVAEL